MKAIILSAGQGKRLRLHTIDRPKCLVEVADACSLLEWQLRQLEAGGVREAVVVTGFAADKVDAVVAAHRGQITVRTLLNRDYAVADNLVSAALASPEMDRDFIILNGDTLITAPIVAGLCAAPSAPVTVSIARKQSFDSDDMKAVVREGRLRNVSKTLPASTANAESIGMIRFQDSGIELFKNALVQVGQEENASRKYYLSAIDRLAQEHPVAVYEVDQDSWAEVDVPEDLERARRCVERWTAQPQTLRAVSL